MNKVLILCSAITIFLFCSCGSGKKENQDSLVSTSDETEMTEDEAPVVGGGTTNQDVIESVEMGYASMTEDGPIPREAYLSSEFSNLEKKAKSFDPAAVDWDYWTLSQDVDKVALKSVDVLSNDGKKAVAVAHLRLNNSEDTNVKVWLVYIGNGWRFSDFANADAPETTVASIYQECLDRQKEAENIKKQAVPLDRMWDMYYSNKIKANDTYTGKTMYIKAIIEKMYSRNKIGAQSVAYHSKWSGYTNDENFIQLDYPNIVIMKATVSGYEEPWYEGAGELKLEHCELIMYDLEE